MLSEIQSVRQYPCEFRRLFQDEYFDLYIWYQSPEQDEIIGFQLCYDKDYEEKALTWRKSTGFIHSFVDTGENSPKANRTPVLNHGGSFQSDRVIPLFQKHSLEIDAKIRNNVLEKLHECQGKVTTSEKPY